MRRAIVGSSVLVLGLAFTVPSILPANASIPRCFGKKATIVGTPDGDHIRGTPRADVIVGLGGDDVIRGLGGDDLICAEKGYDHVYGGVGSDRIAGGRDDDSLAGDRGNDEIYGGQGEDDLLGGPGDDSLLGGAGDEAFVGEPGDDVIDGGAGEDATDWYEAPAPIVVDLTAGTATGEGSDTLAGIEDVFGSQFEDTIVGDSGPNLIIDGSGINSISGMAGDDSFWDLASAGGDRFDGGEGEDWIVYAFAEGPIQVDLSAGTGLDALIGVEDVYGSSGDDVIVGDTGPNQLYGGFDGNDTISGGDGDDLLVGDEPFCGFLPCDPGEGAYNDVLDGGGGIDTVSYESADAAVQVDLAAGTATGQGSDALVNIENVTGSSGNDVIKGDAGPNYLVGDSGWGAGDDILLGAEGDDTLDGGAGTDTLDGGPGTDACVNGETVSNCETSTLPAGPAGAVKPGLMRSLTQVLGSGSEVGVLRRIAIASSWFSDDCLYPDARQASLSFTRAPIRTGIASAAAPEVA